MSALPKRPESPIRIPQPTRENIVDSIEAAMNGLAECRAYEHAVAVRAVEALREIDAHKDQLSDGRAKAISADVLEDIDASGWRK